MIAFLPNIVMKTTLTLLRSNYSTLFFAADAAIAIVILHEDDIRKSSCQPFWISKIHVRVFDLANHVVTL